MDELADAAGQGPAGVPPAPTWTTRRLRARPRRGRAAVRLGRARRTPNEPGVGVGLACGTEKGSFVAACAEVAVDRDDGQDHRPPRLPGLRVRQGHQPRQPDRPGQRRDHHGPRPGAPRGDAVRGRQDHSTPPSPSTSSRASPTCPRSTSTCSTAPTSPPPAPAKRPSSPSPPPSPTPSTGHRCPPPRNAHEAPQGRLKPFFVFP